MLQETESRMCDAIVRPWEMKVATGCNQAKLQKRRVFLPPLTVKAPRRFY